ncbi:MAG: hypothetical protein EBR01_02135 [Proteobacteria bacterium]|nr:hypothetical protein [Pseudomonadota bacterium]
MKWLSTLFFLSTLAFFSSAESVEHALPATEPQNQNHPEAPPASAFQQCEKTVLTLYPKYFGRQNSQRAFHVMLACAGLQGDPLKRKGWKNYLPICPAEPPGGNDWKQDWDNSVAKYHPCADSCFKHSSRKSWRQIMSEERTASKGMDKKLKATYSWFRQLHSDDLSVLDRHYPAQQCCYSRGKLITEGPGAGTPDIIFLAPGKTPIRLRPTGPLRAALFHDRFDVDIIDERFSKWPKGWEEYWSLGWSPVPTRAPKYWGVDSRNRSCEYFKD